MRSASYWLHKTGGSPRIDSCADLPHGSVCWLCGGECSRGMPRADWMGALFTGQNRVRAWASTWVCEPCVAVCAWPSPIAIPGKRAKKEDSKRGLTWRNFSVLWEAGRTVAASKGEKPTILAFLRQQHAGEWFAAVADSGQKHVVPWCPVNPPGSTRGRVLFEERELLLPDAAGWRLVDDTIALLTAGATKEEIARGEYEARTWQRCPDAVDAFESAHAIVRGGAWFDLALWLAQRDEAAVAARLEAEKNARREAKASARRPRGAVDSGAAGRLPRKRGVQRAETLGPDPGPDARGGAYDGERGRVGDERAEGAAPERPERGQLTLF